MTALKASLEKGAKKARPLAKPARAGRNDREKDCGAEMSTTYTSQEVARYLRTESPHPCKNRAASTGSSAPDGSAVLGRLPTTWPTTVTQAHWRYCSDKPIRLIITQ
jgi:hypothetical protein